MKKVQIRLRKNSWIVFAIAIFAWFVPSSNINAENSFGINITVYNNWTEWNEYNDAPPIPPTTPVVGQYVGSRIENYFDSTPVFNLWDDFVIKYEGNIVAPCTCEIYFMAQADDGTQLFLDDQLITYDWYDKGSGGSVSSPISFTEGTSKHIVLWFYENGGGAWVQLWWFINNEWMIVPDSAFILDELTPTATTDSTIPETTTTYQVETTTTIPTSETTTTVLETTTTTIITTTTTPQVTTTTTVAPTTTTTIAVPTDQPEIKPIGDEDIDSIIEKLLNDDTSASEIISILNESEISQEGVQKIIDVIISNTIDTNIAQQLATNETVINNINNDQAEEIFNSIIINELSDEEKQLLEIIITNAPNNIKTTFENTINVFSEGLDGYTPVGSKVDVKTRRIIIAATAAVSTITISGIGVPSSGQSPLPTGGQTQDSGNSNSDNTNRRRRK